MQRNRSAHTTCDRTLLGDSHYSLSIMDNMKCSLANQIKAFMKETLTKPPYQHSLTYLRHALIARRKMMEGELIFLDTDAIFNGVLRVTKELGDQERLCVTHSQTACITDIESNDEREDHRLVFGGQLETNIANFAGTAPGVLCMCMLEAVGIERDLWPQSGELWEARNMRKLERKVFGDSPFSLTNDRRKARIYWWKYGQLYPSFKIEEEVRSSATSQKRSTSSMMVIFRNNLTELIEITTTFDAKLREDHLFNSYVHVTCIVRDISADEDGELFNIFKEITRKDIPAECRRAVVTEVSENDEDDENDSEGDNTVDSTQNS